MKKQNKKLLTPRREAEIPSHMGRNSGLNTVNYAEEGQVRLSNRPVLNAFQRNYGEYIRQHDTQEDAGMWPLFIGAIISIVIILLILHIEYFL